MLKVTHIEGGPPSERIDREHIDRERIDRERIDRLRLKFLYTIIVLFFVKDLFL